MVPLFNGNESDLKIHARKLDEETEEEKGRYVMPLLDAECKSEVDWNNVVGAGSPVTTALLPMGEVEWE